MNAVEIEEAVSRLAEAPFDPVSFPFPFLEAFGNKETTIKRLQAEGKATSNQSDIGGVLQRNNIHLKVCAEGQVTATLAALRQSPKTASQKAKFILATDGKTFEAESLEGAGETVACEYPDFHNHFGFFLPLAGITTVRQIRENAFDIKATSRLNRLYIELLKENPAWDTATRREEMNHFMARLIFCFFAEDTAIFGAKAQFTATIEQMSARDSSNTHEVLSELFRAMNTKRDEREKEDIKSWANLFPYVNGGLFSGSVDVPRFTKMARSYLLHVGSLDWTKINPDIFGSMIQAVADDEERGALGMHYTSVPNILKVLTRSSSTICRPSWRKRGQARKSCSISASASPESASSTPRAAPAISSSSPTSRCGRSRRRSTSAVARPNANPTSRRRTSAASSCGTSPARSPASPSSSPSISATCSIAASSSPSPNSCRWKRRTGLPAATLCVSTG